MKVPHNDFDNIVVEIERMLKSNFSNIYCVKVVALEGEDFQDKGVKVSRKESLVLGDLKNCKLTKQEYDFLNSDIVFSIYK